MNAESKIQADTTRSTIPQHILDRFENEWQQMRLNVSSPQKPSHNGAEKR